MLTDTDTYQTISAPVQAMLKEKGSRFLAYAFPVQNEEEVKQALAGLRRQYYDATHHCYAFMLGPKSHHFRAADDGEPAHTAGTPILNQIRSKSLTDVLVVVVRYFGGTKLGAAGLISAYKESAALVLDAATVKICHVERSFRIRFPYEQMNDVMRVARQMGLDFGQQSFDELLCQIRFRVREKYAAEAVEKLSK